ncbi:MAG TPA: TlpA disulfide reductase family protein [Candidatus Angelobacter sp.]|nr:TlpA disulfide reductase family protein [Candidatus Angelobacter sp.]
MPALESGVHAPEIELTALDGRKFSLSAARTRGPVVVAFFKGSCPVCQLAFPYLERIFKAYSKSGSFTLVGVSQDSAADAAAFNRQFGVTFPVLLDEKNTYPVSNAYGLTNVPTVFVISPQGEIESTTVGWSKSEMAELNHKLAALSNAGPVQIFTPRENVPDFKPG